MRLQVDCITALGLRCFRRKYLLVMTNGNLLLTFFVQAASPVPVIVRSTTPEVVKSLPPIVVSRVMEGPNPWLAFLGPVLLAAAGLTIAVWTLLKVYQQIRIANRQLVIASDELVAVKDDLALAQKQFDLAQRQFSAVMKAPDVAVTVTLGAESAQLVAGPGSARYREIYLDLQVENRGTKVAKDVTVSVFVPVDALLAFAEQPVQIEGTGYQRWSALGSTRLHQSAMTRVGRAFKLKPGMKEITVLWRADDEEYSYPPQGYGRETLQFKLPM